jgi:hypothetical protein
MNIKLALVEASPSIGQHAEGHRQLLRILQTPISALQVWSNFAIQDKMHHLLGREIGRGHMESIMPCRHSY